MTNKTYIVLGIVLGIAIGFVGYGLIHTEKATVQPLAQASAPAGASFNSAKIASEQFASGTSTVYSQFNGDTGDRIIDNISFFATGGVGTSSTIVAQCATSTTVYPAVGSPTNLILSQTLNPLGTTTGSGALYFASTSPGVSGFPFGTASSSARIWPTQSYLVCTTTTSLNSLNILDSGTTGFIKASYTPQ